MLIWVPAKYGVCELLGIGILQMNGDEQRRTEKIMHGDESQGMETAEVDPL